MTDAKLTENTKQLLNHGLDSLRDHGVLVRGCQKVGDARHDADVRLLPDAGHRLVEQGQVLALKDLTAGQLWARPDVRLGDIALHVGVADQGEAPQLRHLIKVLKSKSLIKLLASNFVRKKFLFFSSRFSFGFVFVSFSFSFNFVSFLYFQRKLFPLTVLLTLAESMRDSCLVVDSVKAKPFQFRVNRFVK